VPRADRSALHCVAQTRVFVSRSRDSPSAFQDHTPTAKLVRQVLGAIAEFDKAMTVAKLRGARDRKRKTQGKCEGWKSLAEMHPAVVREAKRLGRASPKSGERRSLRKISTELAKIGEAFAATGLPSAKEAARAYFARNG
jgi:DNA invertase Pin-like site-specific DNA recombinase